MPRVAIAPSRVLASVLKTRRTELGWTLREVQERTAKAGKLIPFTTLSKVEKGKVDPGIKRLHQLLRVYDLPFELASELLDLEAAGTPIPAKADPEALYRSAVEAYKKGDISAAAGALFTLRWKVEPATVSAELQADSRLFFSSVAASIGRYKLAKTLVEEVLSHPGSEDLRARALVQFARCSSRLGMQDVALGALGRAEALLTGVSVPRSHALVHHEKALVLLEIGDKTAARESIQRAIKGYQAAEDTYAEAKAWLGLGRIEIALGKADEGLKSASKAVAIASANGYERIALESRTQVGRAYLALGKLEQAIKEFREQLAGAVRVGNTTARYFAHAHLAEAYRAAGEHRLAAAEQSAAQQFSGFVEVEAEETPIQKRGDVNGASTRSRRGKRKHGNR
jgi:tetratricopeptide (TPR) repeat protein